MNDSRPDVSEAEPGRSPRTPYGVLATVCAMVVGVYAYTAHSGFVISSSLNPADAGYNLLVQSFRSGQLNLRKAVPPEFAQLPDPYDPEAHSPYGMLDMSYYKGQLYLYFGVTPVLILFWPCVALTGHYLLQKDAALIFCAAGFLVSVGLLCALWRRYFAEVSVAVVVPCLLAIGLATGTPFLLARCDVYEVSIGCGYALVMLALAAIWKALHEPRQRGLWLVAGSLAYGLAVAARPSLLPGAAILLIPVAQARHERRKVWAPLMAAAVPIVFIGLGLMLYNALRFDSPFEFGWRYQLAGDRRSAVQPFSLRYLWFNFQVYFLGLARWSSRFPFVHDIRVPPVPAGHGAVQHPLGVLTSIPLVWLALAVPLAWRGRPPEARSTLCGFLAALALLFGTCALTIGLYFYTSGRYEVEFLSTLVLLAVIGILSLERTLGSLQAGRACQPIRRRVARWGWGLLLGFSVAFNLFASVERCAEAHYDLGRVLFEAGNAPAAIAHYEQALRLKPDFADAHNNLGFVLNNQGQVAAAIAHYEQALRLKPDYALTHYNLGLALSQTGRLNEAIAHWKQALRVKPDFAEAHNNLGNALAKLGRVQEAIGHYEQAARIKPDFAQAQNNLGIALMRLGKVSEAMAHYEQALRINPDYPEAHYDLAVALEEVGRAPEAMAHYEQAVRLRPNFAEAHYSLGVALEQAGQLRVAIGHYEQAVRINPGIADAQDRLARLRAAQ